MRQEAGRPTTQDQAQQKPDFGHHFEPQQLNRQLPLQNSVFDSGYYSPNLRRRSPVNDNDKPTLKLHDIAEKLLHAHPRGGHESAWIPIFPVDRGTKINAFKGAGYRLSSLASMHFLTSALRHLEPRIDDDFVDRLNYYYTSTVIIMFAILVSAKQYVGHPIECWVPAQFTKAMEQYTENYCWVQNTYWVPFGDLIPSRIDDRERRQIGYYQWVPFILAIEALMFYIPATVWRLLNTESGINLHGVLQMACNEHNLEPANRARTVHILSRHMDDALRYQRDFGHKKKSVYLWAFIRLGKYYGAYVTLLYVITKLLYLVNVFGQFFLLNKFLETSDYPLFGGHVLYDLLQGREWKESGKFPRVTLCDFEIRVLGNIHRHTVQCVLVINMFTEKIFVFLWLWFLFICIVTLANLIFWLITLLSPDSRSKFIYKQLELSEFPPDLENDRKNFKRFVGNFLRPDGVFMLRMINSHAGTITCGEVTNALWHRYLETMKLPELYQESSPRSSLSGDLKGLTETEKGDKTSLEDEDHTFHSDDPPPAPTTDDEAIEVDPWLKAPIFPGNHKSARLGPGPMRLGTNGERRSNSGESRPGLVPVNPPSVPAVPTPPAPTIEEYGSSHYV